eukprot:3720321-Rhodomonas_salina.2
MARVRLQQTFVNVNAAVALSLVAREAGAREVVSVSGTETVSLALADHVRRATRARYREWVLDSRWIHLNFAHLHVPVAALNHDPYIPSHGLALYL